MARKEILEKHDLLDIIKDDFDLKNDRELAEFLEIQPSMISKIRNGKMGVTPNMLLIIHDATDWSIQKIRGYLPGSSIEQ
jgi:plasmid maintenance system antidote protein VapI